MQVDTLVDKFGRDAPAAKVYTGLRGNPLKFYTENAASVAPLNN
jgi:hypothetical protein